MGTQLFVKSGSNVEQRACEGGVVLVSHRVRGKERVDAEVAHAQSHEATHGIEQLLFCHTELCLRRFAEDTVREGELTGIEPEAHGPGNLVHRVEQGVDVRDVIQVNGGSQSCGVGELLGGGVV